MRRPSTWHALLGFGLIGVAFVLGHDIGRAPHIWFDEGAHLHVAKNFAINGVYADFSSEGHRYTGPVLGVGPTVILPIAGAFELLGVELAPARFVIAIYCLGALAALYALCRNLADRKLALIAVAVMFSLPDFTFFGRSVLGEMPGLFFVLAGLSLWLAPGRKGLAVLVMVGLLLGLACITKNQYAFIVLPSLLLAWALHAVKHRGAEWPRFVVPGTIAGLIYLGWTSFVLFFLGSEERDVWSDFETLRSTSQYALFQWNWENLRTLWWSYPTYGLLCFAAFAFWLLVGRRRSERVDEWDTLMVFIVVAGLLYLTSLGWTRYAFPVMMLAVPVAAFLLASVAGGFHVLSSWRPGAREGAKRLIGSARVAVVAVSLSLAIGKQVHATLNASNHDDAIEMAEYLEANVPAGSIIETLEQEFAIFTGHSFHYPPQSVIVDVTAEWIRRDLTYGEAYDAIPYAVDAPYVLVRARLSTDFYSPGRLARYQPLQTIGEYTLYHRLPSSAGSR